MPLAHVPHPMDTCILAEVLEETQEVLFLFHFESTCSDTERILEETRVLMK